MARLAAPKPEEMDAVQRAVYDEIVAGPRGYLDGPLAELLHIPELCRHVQRIGALVRFNSELPPMHRELAMCMAARHLSSQYVWVAHARQARMAKLPEDIIQALIARQRPNFQGDDGLECVYDFVRNLLDGGAVEQKLYDRALKRFGVQKVIELAAITGQFTFMSMICNVFDLESRHKDTAKLPPDSEPRKDPFP